MTAENFQHLLQDFINKVPLSPWLVGPAIAVLWLAVLLSLKKTLIARSHRYLAGRTNWAWVESLIEALGPTLSIIIVAGSIALLAWILPLSWRAERALSVMLVGAVVLALMVFADRICRGLLARLASRSAALQGEIGLIRGAARGVVIGLALLVFLDSIGISITPLIASLGIGTAAVALALQDTLANLFAGIYMLAEKPIEAGHFIQLESSEQGHVEHVGWRSTQIRMLSNTVVVVPNSKLAGSVITNFSLPKNELSLSVEVGVDYASDLDKVEAITLDVARHVMNRADGAVSDFQPRVHYHTFGDSSVNFKVWLGATSYVAGLEIRHEFIKCLHARFKQERIVIPSPIRTIDVPDELLIRIRECFDQQSSASNRSPNGSRLPDNPK